MIGDDTNYVFGAPSPSSRRIDLLPLSGSRAEQNLLLLIIMALQLSVTPSSSIRSHNSVPRSLLTTCTSFRGDDWSILSKNVDFLSANLQGGCTTTISSRSSRAAGAVAVVKCNSSSSSLDTAAVVKVGQVTEVDKDTFWPIVKGAGDKTVVLDMYTQWCGPCKIIAPKYQELSEKYLDVVFLKLDCNQENKSLAKELGIRVVPTFKIIKEGSIVKEVTGAKFDDLVVAIDSVRCTS